MHTGKICTRINCTRIYVHNKKIIIYENFSLFMVYPSFNKIVMKTITRNSSQVDPQMMRMTAVDLKELTKFIQKVTDSIDIESDLQEIEKNCYQKKYLL